jgi:hypothetical protein
LSIEWATAADNLITPANADGRLRPIAVKREVAKRFFAAMTCQLPAGRVDIPPITKRAPAVRVGAESGRIVATARA